MENGNIDLLKYLDKCPSGMPLESPVFNDVEFVKINKDNNSYPIICSIKGYGECSFTKYGEMVLNQSSKCVLFPITGESWEDFKHMLSDGDMLFDESNNIIFSYKFNDSQREKAYCYFYMNLENGDFICKEDGDYYGEIENYRLASNGEINKMNEILKCKGKAWDKEKKKIIDLGKPKYGFCDCYLHVKNEGVNKFVVSAGYDCEKNGFFYNMGDGTSYMEEDLEEKKLPFNIGDIITDGSYQYVITRVGDLAYDTDCGLSINYSVLDKYSLVVTDLFDYKTLQPFEKVLVRMVYDGVWACDFFSHMETETDAFCMIGGTFTLNNIVPYNNETAHLLNTKDTPPSRYCLISKPKLF